MIKKYLFPGIAIFFAGLFFWTVWPTVYRYEHTELGKRHVLVRINRFSNETEALQDINGWTKLYPQSASDIVPPNEMPQVRKLVTDPNLLSQLNRKQAPMSSARAPF